MGYIQLPVTMMGISRITLKIQCTIIAPVISLNTSFFLSLYSGMSSFSSVSSQSSKMSLILSDSTQCLIFLPRDAARKHLLSNSLRSPLVNKCTNKMTISNTSWGPGLQGPALGVDYVLDYVQTLFRLFLDYIQTVIFIMFYYITLY